MSSSTLMMGKRRLKENPDSRKSERSRIKSEDQ
jgi:hypothetical protein